MELIFDEFYQINNSNKDPDKGFGLGLSLVHRFCGKLGIKLSIDSELGSFTTAELVIQSYDKN